MANRHVYAVVDPADGTVVKEYPTATDQAVDGALDAAAKAHAHWSRQTSVAQRARLLSAVADLHEERGAQLAAIIRREMGKPLDQALGEVEFSASIYRYYAENAEAFLADEPIELLGGEGTALVRRRPVGVLLGIMPWNYPYYQVARFAAPNLALGNTIVLKHASQCPESAAALQQLFTDAGAPEGCYVNVYATREQIAAAVADPRVQGVSFTGSEQAGAEVAAQAGRSLKKVVLELGGSDPFVVLSTDDLDATVRAAVEARFENTGQACNGAKRFIVADDLYDAFLEAFTREVLALTDGLAPLSSVAAAEYLQEQVERAVHHGATFVSARQRAGAHFPPGVLTDVSPTSPTAAEELFGPVAIVHRARSEDEAVELANATPYGLGSYLFTTDADQAARVADRIDAGMVFVNGVGLEGPELPFGGVKRSGFGRELGRAGIDEFANRKLIRTAATRPAQPTGGNPS
ncbi:NAD-dependent succinate-semialdehyde dehydrogenase [Kitasatospora cineracea]|uniref:Succinate-semialdehyde dehydrogenase/glutarate-semialdehyde dehydrogenase n=1 Tax=Kitasatospora cineracea TaxID=88074 RepID=A0A8G1XDF3_9ACTN|nr:NAD-dependent succinate-semialdehyde dehydrogenase [Kitasatospora cineracea]ROR45799.1 succinate-semialdehyde dehydrogenase/glutarate-semialdehyde dehydrogenase [Kitasatospora cineracea]